MEPALIHELKNYVASVQQALEALEHDLASFDEIREMLWRSGNCLVSGFQAAMKPDAAQVRRLGDVLPNMENIVRHAASCFGLTAEIDTRDLPLDQHYYGTVEHGALVIKELACNAHKNGATVFRVRFFVTADCLAVTFTDNGHGMTDEQEARINMDGFEIGCGKSGSVLIKRYVRKVGGDVRWKSIEGCGTRCTILLRMIDPS